MIPAPVDITLRRGDTKLIFFRVRQRTWDNALGKWVPGAYRDLTGWSVLSQIRVTADAPDPPLATFSVTLSNQATTPGGVTLRLAPAVTSALDLPEGGVWDVQLTDGAGDVFTYIAGAVSFEKDVSRV